EKCRRFQSIIPAEGEGVWWLSIGAEILNIHLRLTKAIFLGSRVSYHSSGFHWLKVDAYVATLMPSVGFFHFLHDCVSHFLNRYTAALLKFTEKQKLQKGSQHSHHSFLEPAALESVWETEAASSPAGHALMSVCEHLPPGVKVSMH
ncbi:hypothetical protein MC885_011643, partial [Smutsia gigantea]